MPTPSNAPSAPTSAADRQLLLRVDRKYRAALPQSIAHLPDSYEGFCALLDTVTGLCTALQKLAYRGKDIEGRSRTYVPPAFAAPFAAFQPVENAKLSSRQQLEANYICALDALEFVLRVFKQRYPSPMVVGEIIVMSEGFVNDTVILTVPAGTSHKSFARDVSKAKKLVGAVDADNFNEDLFFITLQREGYGVAYPARTMELNDLLVMRGVR